MHNTVLRMLGGVYRFYRDGFASMTIGRTLWAVIIVKLVVIFCVLKLLFFPDVLKREARDGDKAGYVATQLTDRAPMRGDMRHGQGADSATAYCKTKLKTYKTRVLCTTSY